MGVKKREEIERVERWCVCVCLCVVQLQEQQRTERKKISKILSRCSKTLRMRAGLGEFRMSHQLQNGIHEFQNRIHERLRAGMGEFRIVVRLAAPRTNHPI